jgi:hypothetical protein
LWGNIKKGIFVFPNQIQMQDSGSSSKVVELHKKTPLNVNHLRVCFIQIKLISSYYSYISVISITTLDSTFEEETRKPTLIKKSPVKDSPDSSSDFFPSGITFISSTL